MPRFFVDPDAIRDRCVTLSGDDAHHVSRSLRMAVGEKLTVSDGHGRDYDCVLTHFAPDGLTVTADILSERECVTEPPFYAVLWQALPKGDKLDGIIQKAVECGVGEIRLFESAHCIARSDPKSEAKKSERRKKIALEAAKQSGRGIIPSVYPAVSFDRMLEAAAAADLPLFCYEDEGTLPLGKLLDPTSVPRTVSIVIGSEGGFSPAEAKRAEAAGFRLCGLGKRILRTETASSFVLASLVSKYELS